MKIKELKRTVNVCWSPGEHYPVAIAAGSSAQQVDASFSSSSYLELYALNLEDPGLDLALKASLQTQHKFQKLVWSGAGIIVGGCDGGLLEFYSADKLFKNSSDALLGSNTKHSGNVSALDVNPYQKNLLASGASESEIFIWDLNNTGQPMAPGNRSQPHDHVQGLAWNHQVQHILGSTFSNRCVVWDLRKNEPIMKLSDSQSRTRWRALAWHPSVATQLCIASEDDQVPVIQLWDLRLAASPLVTLEGHQKGVSALSWCSQDPALLLSASKDGRVLCWDPNNTTPGGELLSEISQQQQWVFEVSWCPRDPSLLVAASFDQQVAVHSLLGGSRPETSVQYQSGLLDSFGGAAFGQLPAVARAAPPPPAPPATPSRAPAWLRRPSAAKFSFGGKLVTFEKCPQEAGPQKLVYISQVVSEPEIIESAKELEPVLNSSCSQDPNATEWLAEYCRQKGDAAMDQSERYTWFFLRANFLPTFRNEALSLLGFKQDEIPSKFKTTPSGDQQPDLAALSRGESTETEAELSTDTSTDLSDAHTLIERKLANLELTPSAANVVIPNGEDSTSVICRALVCGNIEEAVELCLDAKRITDALIIASLGSPELVSKVQKYYLNTSAGEPVSLVAGSVLTGRWETLVANSSPNSWRQVLATLLTHAPSDALAQYCEMLGDKLCKESEPGLAEGSTTCYLCAMSGDALAARWAAAGRTLLARAELALLARRAAAVRGRLLAEGGKIEGIVCEYALRLASQGALSAALHVLQGSPATPLADRLAAALARPHAQAVQHQPQPQPQQYASRTRTTSTHSHKRTHVVAQDDVSNTYSAVPAYDAQPAWQQASVPQSNYGAPFQSQPMQPQTMQPQPMQPHTMQPQPMQPVFQPPPQPPRPGSVGPQSGGITSRSKYKVDPSVQAAPLYNQYNFNNPAPQPYGYSEQNSFAPIPAASGNPALNGGYYPPEATPAPPRVSQPAAPGWNDPPMVSSKPKPKPQEVAAQAPITHPLFGVEPQHVPLNAPGPYPAHSAHPAQYPAQQYQQQQAQYPGYDQYQQYPGAMAPAYPQQAATPPPPAPPAPRPPLAAQHAVVQTVLDAIRNDCASRAANPQMKRKLDDVQKKLENLYDMLRENKLSEVGVSTVHACVSQAQSGQFGAAAATAGALASGADFAAAASFLPGLKVLFQLAAR